MTQVASLSAAHRTMITSLRGHQRDIPDDKITVEVDAGFWWLRFARYAVSAA